MGYVLEARGLEKHFGSVHAVRGVDILVGPGERVGLLGPNGAGKTTTLLMVLGAITPDLGSITIAGHRLPKGRSRAMGHVGFAAGYLPLPERLKVREALSVFAGWYGVRDVRRAVNVTMERFEITHLAGRLCSDLSSGQRTLVGIAKAVLHDPAILVLDEPTASLDPDVGRRVRQSLLALCSDLGASLLVTSHDMREVELLTERIVFLAAGQVVANAPAAEIAAQFGEEDLEAVFLELAARSREDR